MTFNGILDYLGSRLHLAAGLPPEDGAGALRARPPVLGRGRPLRSRIPRPPHRAAEAGRLAPALHPGRPPALPRRRPQPAAVGALRHRGPRQRRGRATGQLRPRPEDAPRGDRRCVRHGDDERHPHSRPPRPQPPPGVDDWRPEREPTPWRDADVRDGQQHDAADALLPCARPDRARRREGAAADAAHRARAARPESAPDALQRLGLAPPGRRGTALPPLAAIRSARRPSTVPP